MKIKYTNLDSVKTSGTGGGTHSVLGEPTKFPNSTELINMAHREWKNRQERKGYNDAVPWTSGWISGYLTGKGSLSDELKKERERTLDKYLNLLVSCRFDLDGEIVVKMSAIRNVRESLRGEP